MSGSLIPLTGISAGAQLAGILIRPRRQIGLIVPGVVLSEMHHDELTITKHPVEQGAPISDHAFKQPAQCMIRAGWSAAGGAGLIPTGLLAQNQAFVIAVYQALLDLQASREPFTIWTGKRLYTNMLCASLDVETDERTETALFINARFEEVIIVSTAAVRVASASQQAQPQSTAPTQSTGPTQTQAAPQSLLSRGLSFFGIGTGSQGGTQVWTPQHGGI